MPSLPPPADPAVSYTAVLETSAGEIRIELWPEAAPQTVGNFVGLARDGFYDGTVLHRVVPKFVIQGGGYLPGLKEKKTFAPIRLEKGKLMNLRGTIGLVRTGTSQFYINVIDNAFIDQQQPPYTVFGKVIAGMEVVDAIVGVERDFGRHGPPDRPLQDVVIESVGIEKPR